MLSDAVFSRRKGKPGLYPYGSFFIGTISLPQALDGWWARTRSRRLQFGPASMSRRSRAPVHRWDKWSDDQTRLIHVDRHFGFVQKEVNCKRGTQARRDSRLKA